jgi:hypothetical protein
VSTLLSANLRSSGGDQGDTRPRRIRAADVIALRQAVGLALDHANLRSTPGERARAQAALLTLLQDLVVSIAAARDKALAEMLVNQPDASNRSLAKQLNLSRQRVDQLKRHLQAGGRRPGGKPQG